MILHSVCLILCLKWHETCPACSSRLPYCVPWDLPTPDTWPKGSSQQSDLIGEDGLGLLGLWNAKEETDVSSWYWRHGGRHKVFQGVAPRSRTKEIYMFLLACPELLGSHHNRPCCVVLDCWQLSSSVYVCPQNRHPPPHTHMPLANMNGCVLFLEFVKRQLHFTVGLLHEKICVAGSPYIQNSWSKSSWLTWTPV